MVGAVVGESVQLEKDTRARRMTKKKNDDGWIANSGRRIRYADIPPFLFDHYTIDLVPIAGKPYNYKIKIIGFPPGNESFFLDHKRSPHPLDLRVAVTSSEGTRTRIMRNRACIATSAHRHIRYADIPPFLFDHYAIDLVPIAGKPYNYEIKIIGISPSKKSFFLDQNRSPHALDLRVAVTSSEEHQTDSMEMWIMINLEHPTAFLDWSSFANKNVNIEIELLSVRGLNVKPLRDYSAPTDISDVTLFVEDKKFFLDKRFLASQSEYFEILFYGNFAEKTKSEITLKDVSASEFTDLLDILEHDTHYLDRKESLFAVLELADQWQMTSVISRVQTTLRKYPDWADLTPGEALLVYDKYRSTLQQQRLSWMTEEKLESIPTPTLYQLNQLTLLDLLHRMCRKHNKSISCCPSTSEDSC